MMYYIQIFYSYVLPLMALFSFGYIIYLLLSKRAVFELMENNFYSSVKKNSELSNEAIRTHFESIRQYTKQALQELNTDAREQLQEALSSFEDINKAQIALSSQLSALQKTNAELHNEIKKRDAIIERKTKQIQRLKDAV
ncbi:MAG: hypothetical protein IE909_11335 [Campylobacterales bacterium]|nr:hypothetical protein [Campylobacterales bacterium]